MANGRNPTRYSLLAIRYSPFAISGLAGGILPRLRDLHLGVGHHQSALVRQRHELETHVDRAHRAVGAAAVNAGIKAALAALFYDFLIDLEDFGFLAVEFWNQSIGEAEIGGTDIDAVDALDIEDLFHVFDRRLGLHHRQQHDLFVCGLLISAGRTIHAGTDRAVRARAARRIFAVGDEVFRLLLGVDHRADHAIGAAVQHFADDAGLVPRHAHHRSHRMAVHRLKALHHRLIILHAVLHVDGDAVEPALRDHLGGKPRRDRKPSVHHRLARSPYLLDLVRHFLFLPFVQTHRHCDGANHCTALWMLTSLTPTSRAVFTIAAQVSSGKGTPFLVRSVRIFRSGSPGISTASTPATGFVARIEST